MVRSKRFVTPGGGNRLNKRLTALVFASSCLVPSIAVAQSEAGVLMTRSELVSAESRAKESRGGDNALEAAAIRQRLRDGDFQVGDRVVVRIAANGTRTDTLVVRTGRLLEVMSGVTVPLSGVLRSEIEPLVRSEVLKYVKAQQVDVTPLMRVGILGEVTRPGYFAFASDLPVTDAIMGAGGPSPTASIERSVVKRGGKQFRSAGETRAAIAKGLTLDQFGLAAGDELIVGRRRELISPPVLAVLGVVGSLMTVYVAMQSR
jgi:hypothetical protein